MATNYPDVSDVARPVAGRRASEETPVQAAAIASALCEAFERHGSEAVVVLDDLNELPTDSASAALVEALVRQAPKSLHLVVSSRRPPPFSVQRLRAHGALEQLDADALRFSIDESANSPG
jgi:ATP/maltotriose-dependent transcriptional regulator MalT